MRFEPLIPCVTMTLAPSSDIAGFSVSSTVMSAVRGAALDTGADFEFLMATAATESGFDPTAQASTSSARGLFQFIESTWLATVRDHGADHGLADEAAAIGTSPSGTPTVSDPATRARILALRDDPHLNAAMAGELAADNQAVLEQRTTGPVGETELYLAHFLGAGSAAGFLNAMADDPDQPAADLFPAAARANQAVFYERDGRARSLSDVHGFMDRKMDRVLSSLDSPAPQTHQANRTWTAFTARDEGQSFTTATSRLLPDIRNQAGGQLSLWTMLTAADLPLPGARG